MPPTIRDSGDVSAVGAITVATVVSVDQLAYVRDVGDQDEGLLTSSDLAKRLGVSTRTVARWVQEGRLQPEYTTPGGKHRFRWEDVRAQLGLRER